MCTTARYRPGMLAWVRRWRYELIWQPGHTGRRDGEVDTVAQLRAVVAWARANPRVRRWSIEPVDRLVGRPRWTDACPRGHRLARYPHPHRRDDWLPCAACPGHRLTTCPTCRARMIEPEPSPDCGPPPGWPPSTPPPGPTGD